MQLPITVLLSGQRYALSQSHGKRTRYMAMDPIKLPAVRRFFRPPTSTSPHINKSPIVPTPWEEKSITNVISQRAELRMTLHHRSRLAPKIRRGAYISRDSQRS